MHTTLRQREALHFANLRAQQQAAIEASLRLRAQETARGNKWANRLSIVLLLAIICSAYLIVSINDAETLAQEHGTHLVAK